MFSSKTKTHCKTIFFFVHYGKQVYLDCVPILHIQGLGCVRLVDSGPVKREPDGLKYTRRYWRQIWFVLCSTFQICESALNKFGSSSKIQLTRVQVLPRPKNQQQKSLPALQMAILVFKKVPLRVRKEKEIPAVPVIRKRVQQINS